MKLHIQKLHTYNRDNTLEYVEIKYNGLWQVREDIRNFVMMKIKVIGFYKNFYRI